MLSAVLAVALSSATVASDSRCNDIHINAVQAQHDEMSAEEHAFAMLKGAERTRVLQILEKAKRGEPLTAQMVKVLDDAHVGARYVKKFVNENLSDAEHAALKGAD